MLFGWSHLRGAPSRILLYLLIAAPNWNLPHVQRPRGGSFTEGKLSYLLLIQNSGKSSNPFLVFLTSCRAKHKELFQQVPKNPDLWQLMDILQLFGTEEKEARKTKLKAVGGKRFLLYSIRLYLFPYRDLKFEVKYIIEMRNKFLKWE